MGGQLSDYVVTKEIAVDGLHVLFTDETNLPADPNAKFFAYGGLIIPADQIVKLDGLIAAARIEAGYQPTDELKFETHARPKGVMVDFASKAKRAVVQACIDCGCRFIVYVVLHAIAKNTPQKELISWGADHVIGKFNYYLSQNLSHGLVVVDRLPGAAEFSYLSTKFTQGLKIKDEGTVPLDRIKLFASSCSNASHLSSAMDIVLGSFRYCINQPKNIEAAKTMMANVTRLIWHRRDGDTIHALELGLVFRPRNIKIAEYKAEYENLIAQINSLIADNDEL